jgi:hypothetical protein
VIVAERAYNLRLTEVQQQLEEFPDPVRAAVWKIIPKLAEVNVVDRPQCRVYKSESPAIEIDYEIDPKRELINITKISVPRFRPLVQVFISYSRKDKKWLDELRPFMHLLEQRDQLKGLEDEEATVLIDEQIEPGDEWRERLLDFMAQSRFAVLLVTQQFMTSKFINRVELPAILKRHQEGTQEVLWMRFEPAVFGDENPLEKIQAAHTPDRPPLCDRQKRKRKHVYEEFANSLLARLKKVTDAPM